MRTSINHDSLASNSSHFFESLPLSSRFAFTRWTLMTPVIIPSRHRRHQRYHHAINIVTNIIICVIIITSRNRGSRVVHGRNYTPSNIDRKCIFYANLSYIKQWNLFKCMHTLSSKPKIQIQTLTILVKEEKMISNFWNLFTFCLISRIYEVPDEKTI